MKICMKWHKRYAALIVRAAAEVLEKMADGDPQIRLGYIEAPDDNDTAWGSIEIRGGSETFSDNAVPSITVPSDGFDTLSELVEWIDLHADRWPIVALGAND